MLKKWLKCGFVENGEMFQTNLGTPQGGVVSPTLLNLTLSGLEEKVRKAVSRTEKVNIVIYADDFVVSGRSKEILEHKIKPLIVEFLKERGLTLSEEKTSITNINDGFNFLGFNVRKFNSKLLIQPAKDSVKTFLSGVREVITNNKTAKQKT
jgi:RNA-directed DNA polymerase